MSIHSIEVVRIGYGVKTIEIEAESKPFAEGVALDSAGDHQFSENHSEYQLANSPAHESGAWPRRQVAVVSHDDVNYLFLDGS